MPNTIAVPTDFFFPPHLLTPTTLGYMPCLLLEILEDLGENTALGHNADTIWEQKAMTDVRKGKDQNKSSTKLTSGQQGNITFVCICTSVCLFGGFVLFFSR